jgi:hypothetical protein
VAVSRFAGPSSLRQLLDAVVAIGSDLDLEATNRRIIEAATTLVDARYGALGVLNPERTALVEFITVGIVRRRIAPSGSSPRATASSVC